MNRKTILNPKTLFAGFFILVLLFYSLLVFLSGEDKLSFYFNCIENARIFDIDDSYRFFLSRYAFYYPEIFLWHFTMPVPLFLDSLISFFLFGSLTWMRIAHLIISVATLFFLFRMGLLLNCRCRLIFLFLILTAFMPLYLLVSSSFYAEGWFAFFLVLSLFAFLSQKELAGVILISLLPLVRLEGTFYVGLFMLYYLFHRDKTKCLILAAPFTLYLIPVVLIMEDWSSFFGWRSELIKVFTLFRSKAYFGAFNWLQTFSPLWLAAGLFGFFTPRLRKWWPYLAAPIVLIVFESVGVLLEKQRYEARYFFSMIPVFSLSGMVFFQYLLDLSQKKIYRISINLLIPAIFLFVFIQHSAQLDVVRDQMKAHFIKNYNSKQGDAYSEEDPYKCRESNENSVAELRSFAAEVGNYLKNHEEIKTVLISNHETLYFLDYFKEAPKREVVLIPHNEWLAWMINYHFIGLRPQTYDYSYYQFTSLTEEDNGTALYIGGNPNLDGDPVVETTETLLAFKVLYTMKKELDWDKITPLLMVE